MYYAVVFLAGLMCRAPVTGRAHNRLTNTGKGCHSGVDVNDSPQEMLDLYHLDKALVRRAQIDPESASIVELRYFGNHQEQNLQQSWGLPFRTIQLACASHTATKAAPDDA